jgi:hypothetical protein
MLFRNILEFGLSAVVRRDPRQHAENPVDEAESCALKSDFGHATNIAKAIPLRVRVLLKQLDLDRDAIRYRTCNLSREKPVIGPGRRAHNLPNPTLLPVITPNQSDGRSVASLYLLKFALW